jgi:hypothetical protein
MNDTLLNLDRCEHLRAKFSDHWFKKDLEEVEIPAEFSFPVYRAFLRQSFS